jgi:hypothetical protein
LTNPSAMKRRTDSLSTGTTSPSCRGVSTGFPDRRGGRSSCRAMGKRQRARAVQWPICDPRHNCHAGFSRSRRQRQRAIGGGCRPAEARPDRPRPCGAARLLTVTVGVPELAACIDNALRSSYVSPSMSVTRREVQPPDAPQGRLRPQGRRRGLCSTTEIHPMYIPPRSSGMRDTPGSSASP